MHNNKSHGFAPSRYTLLASAILAAGVPVAQAIELDTGNPDWTVRFDNTVKYNYGVRTESADKRMLATPNNNDGDYNFRKAGTNITHRVDLLTEMDVVYQNHMGFRVSAASWYDKAYENTGSNSNPFVNGNDARSGLVANDPRLAAVTRDNVGNGSPHLSNYAQRYYTGPSGEILDAFVFYSTEVGEESLLSVKAGQHNVFWGETILNPVHSNSYGQSGLDLAKLAASPGTEAKELFVPRNQLSMSFTVNPELTVGAQYFLDWDAARLPEAGTYYGGSDLVGFGAQSFLLGNTNGVVPGSPLGCGLAPCNGLTNVRRGHDLTPDKRGDWGIMAKWSPAWLDGTLGVYYRETSEILPQAWLDARGLSSANPNGTRPAGQVPAVVNTLNSLSTATYQMAYADNIKIVGLSLSKDVGGISVGSDLNIRHNMPLASIPAVVSTNSPLGLGAGLGLLPARTAATGVVYDTPQKGDSMAATGDTLHWTLNGLMTIAKTPVFDSATLLGELYYSNLLKLDSNNEALYKGKDTYRGIDQPTRDNWGIAVNFTPTWYQVFPGVDLNAPMSINVGLDGVSPVSGGGAKDTGNYAIGLGAVVYNKYFVDLKYVDSFGKADKCNVSGVSTGPTGGDGAAPNAFSGNENYACYAGGYSAFSGGGATTEDRGAVYLTMKTTF
ncbi:MULTISPECIES: DUF1302 domain-containing protein [Pseudomonas]|jgi:hypothetical protein|uniref:DUF1302 domain-containing protein n=2 Tax=Pseudomonas mandelii TaxID=75612 RepID=A0ABY0VVE3_9PSED|nr:MULTISPECIES: DUF1302 domain-containing protein [Pseudomonas]MBU0526585.1 DUF1302 domain-containing protein [Gammaproteobacteria bacterium]MDF9880190.1 hypothetical protein [Pseudomonas silensiensis]MDO8778027.1 DUF1302 domain-containing protein [Burkholderiaceae bacterium]AHZ72803.1 hypothetical protein OU5_5724 [Pseudomonas mandelii JR-1]MBU0817492.1 DUF1302 domain-containing protein [Gammaproteobacteria bacterium]